MASATSIFIILQIHGKRDARAFVTCRDEAKAFPALDKPLKSRGAVLNIEHWKEDKVLFEGDTGTKRH